MILRDQFGKRTLGACTKLGHKRRLFARNTNRARQMIDHAARLHIGSPLRYDFTEALANSSSRRPASRPCYESRKIKNGNR